MRKIEKVRLVCLMKLERFGLPLPGRRGRAYPGEGGTVPLDVSVLPNAPEPRSVAYNSQTG